MTPDNLGTPIVDTEDYSFTVTGFSTNVSSEGNEIYPLSVDIQAKNKSSSKEYTFKLEDASVNGLSASHNYDHYNDPVSIGSTRPATVLFTYQNLPNQFCDYSATPYVKEKVSTDRPFYEGNGVKLPYVGAKVKDDCFLYFYVENSTDSQLKVSVESAKLNGTPCQIDDYVSAVSQTASYDFLRFFKKDFAASGVSSPENLKTVELTFDLLFVDSGKRINGYTMTIEI